MKVVLAYSGGLDTSAAILWLKKIKKVQHVSAVLVDVGQDEDLQKNAKNAEKLGADVVRIVDARAPLCQQGIVPMLKAGATYEGTYLLGTAIARPFIADALVDVALEVGATHVCHGATGKGNDYLRFEQRILSRKPDLQILSPWREWQFGGREEAVQFIEEAGLKFETKGFTYSMDANMWHTSYEGGDLENLQLAPPDELISRMNKTGFAKVTVDWKDGAPIAINGQQGPLEVLLPQLNSLISETGFGWLDMVETRANGLKSRGIYHTPGGAALYAARQALLPCYFAGPTLGWIQDNATTYAKMIYEGQWEHPLLLALNAAYDQLFKGTSGKVTLAIQGAQAAVCSREATPNRFSVALGGFGNMREWNAQVSESLVHIQQLKWHSLPYAAMKDVP